MDVFKNLQLKDPLNLNNNTPLLVEPLRVLLQIILSLIIVPFKESLLAVLFTYTQQNTKVSTVIVSNTLVMF